MNDAIIVEGEGRGGGTSYRVSKDYRVEGFYTKSYLAVATPGLTQTMEIAETTSAVHFLRGNS